jgi:TolB-like protein/AraC-like DNA-binding protein/tetratricopeptide (TPR) repeat protein
MNTNSSEDKSFLNRLTQITEVNLSNEQFGVAELAREMGMSRSSVHRHLKALTNQSISHFIRTIRLNKAMKMLQQNEATASEIAYIVGFNSPAYFNHCFHEYFGYPPGEVKKRISPDRIEGNELIEISGIESKRLKTYTEPPTFIQKKFIHKKVYLSLGAVLILFVLAWFVYSYFINGNFHRNYLSQQNKEMSIVVLPFKNLSDNQNNQYFADGITEDILNNLYWITSLRVVSRISAEQYRESTLSARKIARKMKVNYVLEGSVRQYDNKTRISVQLIDARLDKHIWSSKFDRELTDIFGVQGDIALQVAHNLDAVISSDEVSRIGKISTQNHEAYDNYLRARFLLHKANSPQRSGFDKQGVTGCIGYYEKAIAADTTFAEAYAGLANAWFNLSAWGFLPAYEGFPKAKAYSRKAIEYDPDCAEAHAVMGAHSIWGGGRNIEEGSKELKKAVELNPNFSTAHQWYAQSLMITGPIEEARIHVNRALELEPYFWVVQTLSAWIYYFEKKYDIAIEDCKVARTLNPNFVDNNWLFVLNYAKLGEGEKMLQELQSIIKKYSRDEKYLEEIQMAFQKKGISGIFRWLDDVNQNKPIPVEGMDGHPFYSAWWNAILGNKTEAIFWLERTLEYPRPLGHYSNLITTNPDFDLLRNDPRFLEIVDKFGLTPYHKRPAK